MAYRIPEDANTQARIFDLAIADKDAREENFTSLGSERGTPVKRSSERFAGDLLAGNLGLRGQFGQAVNNPEDKASQEQIAKWAEYFSSGPFSPDSGLA